MTVRTIATELVEVGDAATTDGLPQLVGEVVDGDTGQPIEGAFAGFLNPGVDHEAWWTAEVDTSQVAERGKSAPDGTFGLDRPRSLGFDYPYFMFVTGYEKNIGCCFRLDDDSVDGVGITFTLCSMSG